MLKTGTTLYSLTIEWCSGKYSLEELIAEASKRKLGPGLEMVGFQSIRNFPIVTSALISEFRNLMDKYEFTPSCLGANADIGIRRSRQFNEDETVEYVEAQILAAAKLGFPVMRMQMAAKPAVMRKLIKAAERSKVILGMELHSPYTLDHPQVVELNVLYKELDSSFLGYIPDFGCCMQRIPDLVLNSFRKDGLSEDLIELIGEIWISNMTTQEKFAELHKRASALGANASQVGKLNMVIALFSRMDPSRWKEIMDRIVHIHGKFYGFDDSGNEPNIDYALLMQVFQAGGYNGFMSSEYEGHGFADAFSGFDMMQKHQSMCRRLLV